MGKAFKRKTAKIYCYVHERHLISGFLLGVHYPLFKDGAVVSCNISKTSASVSSGFPNTRKLMKARGRRPSAFAVFECLKSPMKHEARVFEIASQSCIINEEQ